MICDYQQAEPGVFRCRHQGCTNAMRAKSIDTIRPGMCKGPGCIHLLSPTDATVTCKGCPGSPRVHTVWGCAVHGQCLPTVRKKMPTVPTVRKCQGCGERVSA